MFKYQLTNHNKSSGDPAFPLLSSCGELELNWFLKQVGVGDNPAPVKAAKHVVIKYDPECIIGFIMTGRDAELKHSVLKLLAFFFFLAVFILFLR